MAKTKLKNKGLFKGVAVGFALVLCSAFFPVNAINALAEQNFKGETESQANTHRISVDGAVEENENSITVIKGDDFTIPQGVYYNGSNPSGHVIGTTISDLITVSKVEIINKGTGKVLSTLSGLASFVDQTFTASELTTYVIRYTVVDNGVEYSYDFNVETLVSDEVSFEFRGNDKNIIPTHYDKEYANGKNITLPLPNINDEDGDPILSSEASDNYIIDINSRPTYTTGGVNSFVYISLAGGSMDEDGNYNVKIKKDDTTGKFYIDGADFTNIDSGTEFTITYYFYEIRENGNISYVNSTTRTFTVWDDYYHITANGESGYNLSVRFSEETPDSAVVGVAVDLPSVSGTTSASNSPSSEAVEVSYTLQVLKMDDNDNREYTIDVTTDVYDEIENTFTAKEEGSYRFIYKVEDFYGNKPSTSTTSFTITNVEDTQQATPIMYDAGEVELDKNGDYIDISYKLKSQSVNRNIIMYAITGKDNMVTDVTDLTFKRVIRDSSTTRFEITEYNDKNLIFGADVASGDPTMDNIYLQIVADNFDIYRQMSIDKVEDNRDLDDPAYIRDWLIKNNYLIVTTNWNQDPTGAQILKKGDEGYSEKVGDQTAKGKMADKGFAYLKSKSEGVQYNFPARTYYFDYYADDNVSNIAERREVYRIVLQETISDTATPTINFSSDLKSAYLPTDTITFNTATASDTIDTSNRSSSVKVVTAYRFLDGKNAPVSNDSTKTNKTLQFIVNDNVATSGGSQLTWIEENKDATTGLVTSTGWFFDTSVSSYTIDLRDVPSTAETLEIFAYAVDDFGNIAFFSRKVTIMNTADSDMPVLVNVENAPDATEGEQTYLADDDIILPNLDYRDSRPEYMTGEVAVYKVTTTGEGADMVTNRELIQSVNASTDVDTYRGIFTVYGGTFTPSTDGTYQVVVTVKDNSNHTLSTYFTYYVKDSGKVEDPEISNITTEPVDIQVNYPYDLEVPRLTVTESDLFGYIGLDSSDDTNTSTYYTVSAVSASDSYKLTQYQFTGETKGNYRLQYTAFLMRYRVDRLLASGASSEEAGIYLEDGKLKYKEAGASATSYYIYFERVNNQEGNAINYIATMNTALDGSGDSPEVLEGQTMQEVVEAKVDGLVEFFDPKSEIQEITVSDAGINVTIDESAYEKNQYPTVNPNDPYLVPIVMPQIEIIGQASPDYEESRVIIECVSDGTTTPIATISLADWESAVATNSNNFVVKGETISLRLIRNGTYTIKYEIYAQDKYGDIIGDPKTLDYTITSGDIIPPTVTILDAEKMAKATYGVGETLVINLSKDVLNVSDNVTTDRDELLSKLSITITNNDTGDTDEITNRGDETYLSYEYELTEVGSYTVSITVEDRVGNVSNPAATFSFEVTSEGSDPVDVQEILGGILIALSVGVLAGVVIYFVVSKVKLDRRAKGYQQENKKLDKKD